jgi:hypothetical protein
LRAGLAAVLDGCDGVINCGGPFTFLGEQMVPPRLVPDVLQVRAARLEWAVRVLDALRGVLRLDRGPDLAELTDRLDTMRVKAED